MLNFRKLKQDFSSGILKEGKDHFEKKKVIHAKVISIDTDSIRVSGKVDGNFNNSYESEIEIDRFESETIHSNCDCSYRYDCQHLAALVFHLEEHLDAIIVEYSKEKDFHNSDEIDIEEKKQILQTIKEAHDKKEKKEDQKHQKETLEEYLVASKILSTSAFFMTKEDIEITQAEIAYIYNPKALVEKKKLVEFQLALRLPSRSKPLNIPHVKFFLEALRYQEPLIIGGKRYYFSLNSFDDVGKKIIEFLLDQARFNEASINDRAHRVAQVGIEDFGMLLSSVYNMVKASNAFKGFTDINEDLPSMPYIFSGNLETPLACSFIPSELRFEIAHVKTHGSKIFLDPTFIVDQSIVGIKDVNILNSATPAMIYQDVFYPFKKEIKRLHLNNLDLIRDMTIPEPLIGTFVENSLPELRRYAKIAKLDIVEKFVTLPYAGELEARCKLSYLDGELEASLYFTYDNIEISSSTNATYNNIRSFVTEDGILARNLVEERKIIEDLFQDFIFNSPSGSYVCKSEKKIVEFMTDIVPRNNSKINFECPQNLLDQFIYDKTDFILSLDYKDKVGHFSISLKVNGELKGVRVDLLWECISSNRSYIELDKAKGKNVKKQIDVSSKFSKILVIDLNRISKIIQLFDEIGIKKLDNHVEDRPLWSLVTLDEKSYSDLPIKITLSNKLSEIRKQMLGINKFVPSPIPTNFKKILRSYQTEGIHWLEHLKSMFLNGILADDMGLGKTLQAIVAITQYKKINPKATSLVVCPTTLLYNWKEELFKFNPKLNAVVIDGIPNIRKKIIADAESFDVVITSYTLLQKDVDLYKEHNFAYTILDEAQHIKNRSTRNAKSVKKIVSAHRLILTGTPIENSLEELWSLFDFLMPGLLSTYDRYSEKFIRSTGKAHVESINYLKRKVMPFILRRMKVDVLKDLPAVSELTYHCQLTKIQKELYLSYAKSAKEELTKLVRKEGFEKVHIHVLATLTRLKQICCHPAIFAKEKPEIGDSAKYEMLLELLKTLMESNHKTVIFSQYTKMLHIMRNDFIQRGINFSYLDGTTKNRLDIVKEFNENEKKQVFLVSLKAGGTGLNITGADTVIHYDMWWNPAVENQATDRVHRIGQKKLVSAYKLVTLNSIEEKIVEMQRRKKGLVKQVISCDDEAMSSLTWDEVLELLQT
jgi:SNF2 family DNA or RNA helicase